ncbi:MAG TPA: hypothetical protein VFG04_14095 [Planctomycetaceae bacterium]|nr:hypothetical protein [Planctomycetaceae bacterium]
MTNLRDLDERLTRIEEDSYEAVRLANYEPGVQVQLVTTQQDPDKNYPPANTTGINQTYWGKPLSTVAQSNGTSGVGGLSGADGLYFTNLGWGYIPINSTVEIAQDGPAWFCTINYPNKLLGTSSIDINPQMGPFIFPNPQITLTLQDGTFLTTPCNNPWKIMAPAGYPLQVEACGWSGQFNLTGPQGTIVLPATINTDVAPGGTGLVTPQMITTSGLFAPWTAIGQVTANDVAAVGALSGKTGFIMYVGQWVLLPTNPCA